METRATMVLSDGNESISLPIPGPGGTIRFVVGDPGRQSGVWRIWANKGTFDVYIGVRALTREHKWSLHETGDWRFQWVNEDRAVANTGSAERIMDRWRPPSEMGSSGWTQGFQVRVRHEDLVHVADPEVPPADTVWIAPPPLSHTVVASVIIARPDAGWVNLDGITPHAGFALVDGRIVLLVSRIEPTPDKVSQAVDRDLARAVEQASATVDLSRVEAPRALLIGNTETGDRLVWDAAVQPVQGIG